MTCQFLRTVRPIEPEVGGDPGGTVFPRFTECRLRILGSHEDPSQCEQTPLRGPCWDMKGQFESVEQWEGWAHSQLQRG